MRKCTSAASMTLLVFLTSAGAKEPESRPDGLTAQDYIDIQQLVAQSAYAEDTAAENGYMYADLFTPEGSFGRTKGRNALAAMVRKDLKFAGPHASRRFLMNVVVAPLPNGASGRQYSMLIDVGDATKPSTISGGGHYEDVYTKTSSGWKFKSRNYFPAETGPRPISLGPLPDLPMPQPN